MAQELSRPRADRAGPARRRASLMVVPALLVSLLAGCGDPGGGGGSGYVTSQQPAPAER